MSFVSLKAKGEHIIGGELTYVCLGGNLYEFTLKIYRDCASSGAPFDDPASFAVFDENNFLIQQFSQPLQNSVFIDATLDSPCLALPPNICVQEGTYVFTYAVPSSDQSYQFVYQRCCRNQTIQNLVNPGAQGLTLTATVPAANIAECNSSPSFDNFPPPVLCASEELVFDHGATDLDGDSLVYSLCSPNIGGSQANPAPVPPSSPPYTQVLWADGYSATNPIDSESGFSIDPQTGLLTGTPTVVGQFVIGVCVEEWRNGQLVSVNTRDFQFNVAPCEQVSEALVSDLDENEFCQDLTFNFFNESNPNNTFNWDFGDPTTEDDQATSYNASYTYPDTGLYVVTLITNAGFFCSDTVTIEVPVYFDIQIEIESYSFDCVNGVPVFDFTAGGTFDPSISTVTWDFGPDALTQSAQGLVATGIEFTNYEEQSIQVEVVNDLCSGISDLTFDIPDPPLIDINEQTDFCSGLVQNFSAETENVTQYSWDFGVDGIDGDISTQAAAIYTFPDPGIYTVTLTGVGDDNCPATDTETFEVWPLLAPQIPNQPIACFDGNSFDFEADGSFTDEADFEWTFEDGQPSSGTGQTVENVSFLSEGVKTIVLVVSENGCVREVENEIIIHPNPVADFIANPLVGCAPLQVSFANQSISESSSRAFEWDFGDGSGSNLPSLLHEYTDPGVYTVSLSLENLNGCIDSDAITKEQLIEVLPSPKASFTVEPTTISVYDPVLEVTSLSEGNVSCLYYLDGEIFESCEFTHELDEPVPQTINLVVTNEFGCKDRAELDIRVSDHIIYVPSAFTPDGDGLNDFFFPVMTGVVSYEMSIFNRWGELIFTTSDPKGWNGASINSSDYYAQAGLYTYKIILTDYDGWNFEYIGSIRLIR